MRFVIPLILLLCFSISGCKDAEVSNVDSKSSPAPEMIDASPVWVSQSRKENSELLEVLDYIDALYDSSAHEFFIRHDGMIFYISCPVKKESLDPYASIMLFHNDYTEVKDFTISSGNRLFHGPHHAGNEYGANEFFEIINEIRSNDVNLAFDGQILALPQSNVSTVIPPVSARSFPCKELQAKVTL
ncbi:hypothetical protein [Stutzerimonas nitrititolerans]|uniref:hypothetical protein n=1 Tax=Stutzerimonas nitrititolerans TaxID=2482751 RepID=UPI0014831C8D|nr:hypothetical protein [Stutzerimonas nitrititolerans]NNT93704.1 hypothetical protein [Stutzerimonas nitrititolerans]